MLKMRTFVRAFVYVLAAASLTTIAYIFISNYAGKATQESMSVLSGLAFVSACLALCVAAILAHSNRRRSGHRYFFESLARMTANLGSGLVIINRQGFLEYYNDMADKILRITPAPSKPNIYNILDGGLFQPEQAEGFRKLLRAEGFLPGLVIGEGDAVKNLELATVFVYSYTVCVLRDLTEKVFCEMLANNANEMLEEAIERRTSELMVVNRQLSQENTERRAAEQAFLRAESRYSEIVNNSIEGIIQFTQDGRLLSANPAMSNILGYSAVDELLEAYKNPGRGIGYTPETDRGIIELLEERGWMRNVEIQARMQSGIPIWVSMSARRVPGSHGETAYYEAFVEDITSRKKTEEKLVYQAFHDSLTGLPNRALFLDRLRMAMRRAKRHEEYPFAVLYLDLDRFKSINDKFGHNSGDHALKQVAEKLMHCVREADTVARFGGDEFAILISDLEKPAQAIYVARRISAVLGGSITFGGQKASVGASIGIVLSNSEYDTPEEVLRDADTAMYRAKLRANRRFIVFNKRMREETIAALALEQDLRGAVERGEIDAYYQPLVQISDGKVYGFEALMRWRHNGEIIEPHSFIPFAEASGLINELGLEMLEIVSNQINAWNTALGQNNYSVHVNISGRQIMSKNFWRDVRNVLEKTGVNPHQLIFEITESVFLDYGGQVLGVMNKIREEGIRFCLDDFGTGFSSLNYLRVMPIESLKIDRSFIIDLQHDRYAVVILRNTIALSNDLGLDVIAEGIEQNRQVEILSSIGCVYSQGYYFARPLTGIAALEYIWEHGCAGQWDQ